MLRNINYQSLNGTFLGGGIGIICNKSGRQRPMTTSEYKKLRKQEMNQV